MRLHFWHDGSVERDPTPATAEELAAMPVLDNEALWDEYVAVSQRMNNVRHRIRKALRQDIPLTDTEAACFEERLKAERAHRRGEY